MLSKIDVASIEYARLILMWLCFAKRPLTAQEVIDGVVVELGDNARVNLKRRLQDEDDILQICPGFIDIEAFPNDIPNEYGHDRMARTLRIAHYSVQEYLQSDRIRQQGAAIFSMQSATSNLEATQICLVYLLGTVFPDAELSAATLARYPFAEYAATYWYEHYKSSDERVFPVDPIVMRFFKGESSAFQNWIRMHDPDRPYESPNFERDADDIASPVYYASLLGLRFVLHELLDLEKEEGARASKLQELSSSSVSSLVNVQGGDFSNALQAACWRGNEKIVQLLLDKGAAVNAQGGYYGNTLQAASKEGHEKIVQLLLDKGAEVNAQGGYYGNALQAASSRGHEKIVQLLLDKGAEANAQGGEYGNALQAACWRGHEKIVQLLLDKGAAVNAQGGYYGNTLQAACWRGHEKIVQLLLDIGAEVSTQGGKYGNALQAASAEGHEKIVQILLDKGAEANAQGGYYGNTLQAACWGGHEKIIKLLLENGVEVNAQGGLFGNALQAACSRGHEKTVQLLLDKGAEVHAEGGFYGDALQAASCRNHEHIVQLLLDKGAEFSAQGRDFGNALQEASSRGFDY
jgi:ankyrin repeat protein